MSRMAYFIIGITILAGCGTEGVLPAGDSTGAAVCRNREYSNSVFGIGFDLPGGVSGPEYPEVVIGNFATQWREESFDAIVALSYSRYAVWGLEEEAKILIALSDNIPITSEPITLDSGQLGWIIESIDNELLDDFIFVKTLVIGTEFTHSYTLFGISVLGTNDFDYLRRIAKTLCAE